MIETKHGDHKVQYDEESNIWQCKTMRCSAPSLSALRTKLNAEDREDRRVSNIRVFSLDRGYDGEASEVVITMIDTGHHGVNGYRVGRENIKKREYFSLHSLVIINGKNAPKIERYKQAARAAERASEELDAARAVLPVQVVGRVHVDVLGRIGDR